MKIACLILAICAAIFVTDVYSQQWVQTSGPCDDDISAIAASKDGDVYASTGNMVHCSGDKARTWKNTFPDSGSSDYIRDLFVQPSGIVLALTQSSVFRSTDKGSTWEKAVSHPWLYQGSNGFLFSLDSTIILSKDDGKTWTKISSPGHTSIYSFIITSDLNGEIFVFTDTLYHSLDAGKTWQVVTNSLPTGKSLSKHVVISPSGDFFLYSSDRHGLFLSKDRGITWQRDSNIDHSQDEIQSMCINASGQIVTVAPTPLVMFSLDAGGSWSSLPRTFNSSFINVAADGEGSFYLGGSYIPIFRFNIRDLKTLDTITPPNASIRSLGAHPSGSIVAFSPYSAGVSNDSGMHWGPISMRSIPTTSIFEASGNMLAGGTGEVFLSSDAGRSWNNYPLSPSSTATFSAFAETQDGTIYAATSHGIFYSTNHGYQWDSLHTGLVKTPFYSIAIAKNGNIFAGSTKTIYRSTDNGSSWKNLNISIPSNGGKITTLLAATGGGLMAGTDSSGVYYSTDNGDSWESNSLGISGSKINTLLEVPDKRIFAATSEGVFYIESIDAAFWWPYNDGLPIKDVNAICLGADGHLYVGAQRSGVLRSTEIFSHQSGVKLTGNLSPETLLGTNYPNPFSASTTIPFSLAERSFITIEVLDALGRSVAEVASGVYEAGKYETKFDAGNLAAGTYFIRLKTENKSYFSACVVSK